MQLHKPDTFVWVGRMCGLEEENLSKMSETAVDLSTIAFSDFFEICPIMRICGRCIFSSQYHNNFLWR